MSLGVNGPETAILEQLRLQEGRLFQGEKTLALYLDVKAVALDLVAPLIAPAGPSGPQGPAELEEDSLEAHVKTLKCLAPKGTHEYHERALHDSVKTVAKLLWPTQMLLVARPKLSTLLSGLYKRLKTSEPIKSGAFASLDPFKQDFVIREAFRRTLVNDCLVVFESEDAGSIAGGANGGTEGAGGDGAEDDWAERLDGGVGPDDSASQAPPARAAERQIAERPTAERPTAERPTAERPIAERPPGARSALGPIGERDEAEQSEVSASGEALPAEAPLEGPQAEVEAALPAPVPRPASVVSRARSAMLPLHQTAGAENASVVRSVAPKVITVTGGASVLGSSVSHATGLSGSSILHKLNVRKVRITPDEQP